MAKLIGHHFNGNEDEFSLFEVDGLKETPKQYTKTRETTDSTPKYTYEYWTIMPKTQLGELRKQGNGSFTMYAVQEDMPRFKALVIDSLTQTAERAKEKFQNAARMLNKASGEDETPDCPPRYCGTCLPGDCKHSAGEGAG